MKKFNEFILEKMFDEKSYHFDNYKITISYDFSTTKNTHYGLILNVENILHLISDDFEKNLNINKYSIFENEFNNESKIKKLYNNIYDVIDNEINTKNPETYQEYSLKNLKWLKGELSFDKFKELIEFPYEKYKKREQIKTVIYQLGEIKDELKQLCSDEIFQKYVDIIDNLNEQI